MSVPALCHLPTTGPESVMPNRDLEMIHYQDTEMGDDDHDTEMGDDWISEDDMAEREAFGEVIAASNMSDIDDEEAEHLFFVWSILVASDHTNDLRERMVVKLLTSVRPYLLVKPDIATAPSTELHTRQGSPRPRSDSKMPPAASGLSSVDDDEAARDEATHRIWNFFCDVKEADPGMSDERRAVLDDSHAYWHNLVIRDGRRDEAKQQLVTTLFDCVNSLLKKVDMQADVGDTMRTDHEEAKDDDGYRGRIAFLNTELRALSVERFLLEQELREAKQRTDQLSQQLTQQTTASELQLTAADAVTKVLLEQTIQSFDDGQIQTAATLLSCLQSHFRIQAMVQPTRQKKYKDYADWIDPNIRSQYIARLLANSTHQSDDE